LPQWVMPGIQQGDSRALASGLAQADACVSSPPFAGVLPCRDTNENMQALHDAMRRDGKAHGGKVGTSLGQDYGSSPGQLGNLPPGTLPAALAVSSPPYAELLQNYGPG